MGNNSIGENENILVRVDQQNIIHVDPNSILTQDGEIKSRLVDHENLITYVNLEADLVPRSILFSENDQNTLLSIASGTFNMMRNQGDKNEFENNFDSDWTNVFVPDSKDTTNDGSTNNQKYDPSAQTFGIQSMQISIKGASSIPQVSINFLDVRGKTLFESPSNSPYKAFFHQPWPVFYLTVKGYFGKAIRYRLHLVDFKTKFNSNTGNFEITTKFVGSTYAYLSDILLQNIMNAPYMYMVEKNEDFKTNEKTGFVEKKISKTTKGYSILKSVYDEYRAKGFVPQDFPDKTLRDLLMTANSLDKILEQTLFDETVDPTVLSHVAEYDSLLTRFENRAINWASRNLSGTIQESEGGFDYYPLNKPTLDKTKTTNGANSGDIITGSTNNASLQTIIDGFIKEADTNTAFGKNVKPTKEGQVKTFSIDLTKVSKASDFVKVSGGNYSVSIDKLISKLKEIQNTFVKARDTVETDVEKKMNQIIKDPNKGGFGFEPTIRNIFAVILANADTYIRLMKDVHTKAIRLSETRKEALKYKINDDKNESLYPWPEVKKKSQDRNTYTHYYPGDNEIEKEIQGRKFSVWPEVEFVETYNSIATKRVDPLSNKEISSSEIMFVFEDDLEKKEIRNVSSLFKILNTIPYSNKTVSGVLYEIFERAEYLTSFDSFTNEKGLDELYKKEFETLDSAIQDDIDIRELLATQIKTVDNGNSSLNYFMKITSPNERYPYFLDRLPTTEYIRESVDVDFNITEYNQVKTVTTKEPTYPKLQGFLDAYKPEDYRFNISPFNSELYKKYIGGKKISQTDYNFKNILSVNSDGNFISSPIDAKAWVDDKNSKNLFTKEFVFSGTTRNMLNTPYFHKQLFNDFLKGGSDGRYVGSAYLLLNSLPYKDLDDHITFNGESVLMSSLFREVGSTHYVPHHLLLKWGSIYHRYKKYILDNVDILAGITTPIDTKIYFNNNTGTSFDLSAVSHSLNNVDISSENYLGLYPYYHGVYHQIVNGYSFYNPSGFTQTDADAIMASYLYEDTISNGVNTIKFKNAITSNEFLLTSIIDNSKFDTKDLRYTILPSNTATSYFDIYNTKFKNVEQDSFKIIFDDVLKYSTEVNFAGVTFPTYKEKLENESGLMSIVETKKKVVDLIATFSPKLLDEMETMFIKFSSLNLNLDNPDTTTHDFNNFQILLKEISSVPKEGITLSSDSYDKLIYAAQTKSLEKITETLLSGNNLKRLTIANPKQVNNYAIFKLAGTKELSKHSYTGLTASFANAYTNSPSSPNFDASQLTSQNYKFIELYIGENITDPNYVWISNIYANFFEINDIEVNEENIYEFRELARIYAGWVKTNSDLNPNAFIPTKTLFVDYVRENIYTPQINRRNVFLNGLISRFPNLSQDKKPKDVTIYSAYNEDKTLKLDMYQFFKSFNDKWVSGNAIGQRNLMEEFLFVDRANRDIGSEAYISLDRLISLSDPKNIKVDLYSAITILIQGTNFDMRPLPAYINFYGTNSGNKKRITPSKNLARNLFGTFLEVDYQESSPKIILQHVGNTSKYLDLQKISKEYRFKNDSFDISDTNNNPLLVEPKVFMDADLSKSNRVVSFEVNFGDQGQGIFKSISLDQATYKNTTESAIAQERLARSQSGGGTTQVDIGLFDIYKTASYQCEVTMMGDVMIQPTMYFYLSNVPMFQGTYLIFEVNHNIKGNAIETSFKGVRVANSSLPKMSDSFVASYRPLFSRILSAAVKKKQEIASKKTTTEKVYQFKGTDNVTIDAGTLLAGEDIDRLLVRKTGFYQDLIPYNGANGEKYIQMINRNGEEWLRTKVVMMGNTSYPISDTAPMSILSARTDSPKIMKTWADIKSTLFEFYSVRLKTDGKETEKLANLTTTFLNPKTNSTYELTSNINATTGKYDGAVHNGPGSNEKNAGLGMSARLMKKLKLNDGDVVYFKLK
jgi:hypothetical protein